MGVLDTDGKVSVAAKLKPGNDGIAISKEGRVFVSGLFLDTHLYEIYPDDDRVVIPGGLDLSGGVALIEAQGRTNLMVVDIFAIRKFDPKTGKAISAVRDVTMATDVGWMLTVNP